MSEQRHTGDTIPEIEVKERRGVSIVWLIPLVAAAIAGWLVYTTLSEQGPTVTISFKTAAGLEAGKTKVKFKDVQFGLVESLRVSDDLSKIIVTAVLDKEVAPHLKESSRFWVVRPRLGAGGVSGLDTLVSGAYIGFDPGEGETPDKPTLGFVGLEEPPVIPSDEPGKAFTLVAESKGSLGSGSPVFFRGIQVGKVFDTNMAGDRKVVEIEVFVRQPFDDLVRENSRFWDVSGFDVSFGSEGFKIDTESLQSIIAGGVTFSTPTRDVGVAATEGTHFRLYKEQEDVERLQYVEKVPYLTHFEGSVRGLQEGAPVDFRGIRIGTVTEIRSEFKEEEDRFLIPVTFEIEPGRFRPGGAEQDEADAYKNADQAVRNGLRAQLVSGNILTGQLFIQLEFFPDEPPETLDRTGIYPAIPSVPSTVDQLKRSVTDVLATLSSLKLPELIADARSVLQSVDGLVKSPQIAQTLVSLEETLQRADSLMGKLDQSVGPLMSSLTDTSLTAKDTLVTAQGAIGQAQTTLATAEGLVSPNSQTIFGLNELLRELTEAARSIRILTDYLEAHPEALLRGKGGAGQ